MQALSKFNYILSIAFVVCYAYQLLYIPISLFYRKKKEYKPGKPNRFGILICARNEELVVGHLVESLKKQTYDQKLITVFVMADNCTDRTAECARAAGAVVYERTNAEEVGKGYAMKALLRAVHENYPDSFDGYFVFDADNLLNNEYIERMNAVFSEGHDIVTSYRNCKNYGDNWISAGQGLWFLRESRFLNYPRWIIHTSSALSGTGYMFSQKIANELVDWPYTTLVEDIEFTMDTVTKGRKIAYCIDAEYFDEQPVKFSQSWWQRMRWSRGGIQVFLKYTIPLIKGIFRGSFSCFDMLFNALPAAVLSVLSIITTSILTVSGIIKGEDLSIAAKSVGQLLLSAYGTFYMAGAITTITEWKHIYATTWQKIWATFTFPLYMATFAPIAAVAAFYPVKWKHIDHTVAKTEMKRRN